MFFFQLLTFSNFAGNILLEGVFPINIHATSTTSGFHESLGWWSTHHYLDVAARESKESPWKEHEESPDMLRLAVAGTTHENGITHSIDIAPSVHNFPI